MKTLFIISFLSLLITSCDTETIQLHNIDNLSLLSSNDEINVISAGNTEIITTKYFPVSIYNKQRVTLPFPSNWQHESTEELNVLVQSPTGIKVFNPIPLTYIDYRSELLNKRYKEMGAEVSAVKDVNTFIREQLIPFADSSKLTLTNQFELSNHKSLNKTYDELSISTYRPESTNTKTVVTEWQDEKDLKSIVVIEHSISIYKEESVWGVLLFSMDAPASEYEEAKEIFLNSIKNIQPCFHQIYDQNKVAIYAITNNYTAQYFTPEQEKERREKIWAEQERTGTYQYEIFEKYIDRLKARGVSINNNAFEICESLYVSDSKQWKQEDYSIDYEYSPEQSIYPDTTDWSTLEPTKN